MKFLFLFILISCGSVIKNNQSGLLSVAEQNELNKINIDTTEQVSEFYGPKPVEDLSINNKEKTNHLLGLIVIPSSENSYRYVGFLKYLEENKIQPKLILTSGFPLFLFSHYGFEKKVTPLEWYIFKNSKNEKNEMYSKKWLKYFADSIDDYAKNKKMEQAGFIIQAIKFKEASDTPVISSAGNLQQILIEHVNINENNIGLLDKFDYIAHLKNLGVNKIIIVDAFDDKVDSNGIVNFTSAKSKELEYENDSQVLYLDLNIESAADTNSSFLIQEGYKITQENTDRLKKFMEL